MVCVRVCVVVGGGRGDDAAAATVVVAATHVADPNAATVVVDIVVVVVVVAAFVTAAATATVAFIACVCTQELYAASSPLESGRFSGSSSVPTFLVVSCISSLPPSLLAPSIRERESTVYL
jgi:hypothetical protein